MVVEEVLAVLISFGAVADEDRALATETSISRYKLFKFSSLVYIFCLWAFSPGMSKLSLLARLLLLFFPADAKVL